MATVNQIKKDNLFASDPDSKKMFDYIELLACTTNTNLNRWDITKIFGSGEEGEENKLVSDKNEINKRFFETLANRTTNQVPDSIDAVPELLGTLNECLKASTEQEKNRLKRAINEHTNRVKRLYLDVNNQLSAMAETKKKLAVLDGENLATTVAKEIDTILGQGIWVNPIVATAYDDWDGEHKKFLYLNTAKDIIVKHSNKQAGINLEANFGQLAVKINLSNLNMIVIPYKNNISYSSYFHPHACDNGQICWGDAREKVSEWQKSFQLANILQMLYSLLINYNDGNPYAALTHFKNQGRKYKTSREVLQHPDKRKKKTLNTASTNDVVISTEYTAVSSS